MLAFWESRVEAMREDVLVISGKERKDTELP